MTTQLTEMVEHADGAWSTQRKNMPKGGAQPVLNRGCAEPAPPVGIAARRTRVAGCPHYWIIEFAWGPVSKGACKTCGEERLFRNQLRWAEIAPVKPANGWRQVNDSPNLPEQREARSFLLAQGRSRRSSDARLAGMGSHQLI
jgi:hypothetical protein